MLKLPQSPRVALLIDADNAQLKRIAKVLRFSASQGSLTINHAYGDWNKRPLSSWREKIRPHKITLMQQKRNRKNATDRRLIAETEKILASNIVDIFIIVSSDHHFTPLCRLIKDMGKDVIIIGNKNYTSKTLLKSCANAVYIEDL
jgi:uncharacterized LabA/DUF88 family protein